MMTTIFPEIFSSANRIVAGFSTRDGGVSEAPYDSLNLGLSTNDQQEHVLENRRRLFTSVGYTLDQLAIAGQVHGTNCLTVDSPGLYRGCDALVSRTPGILLCLSAADCASVLMVDPEAGVIGACHAGWRGAAGGIVETTLEAMQTIGAATSTTKCYISPCISLAHFEVGDEVAAQFSDTVVYQLEGKNKPHIDLKGAIYEQLIVQGISAESIETSPHCTFGETERFFSHRAEKGLTGRLMGFIGIQSDQNHKIPG